MSGYWLLLAVIVAPVISQLIQAMIQATALARDLVALERERRLQAVREREGAREREEEFV